MAGGAPNLKPFAEAITRIGDLFSLASLIPVLLECRFGGSRIRHTELLQEKQQEQQKEGKPPAQSEWPSLPLGIPSTLLFLASEALACRGIFVTSAQAASKSKSSVGGPLGTFLKGITKGQQVVKSKAAAGTLDKMSTIVVVSLDQPGAFDAAHGIVMLVSLGTVIIALLGRLAWPMMKQLGRRGSGASLLWVIALTAPVLLFGFLRWQAVMKAWKVLRGERMLANLQAPLRAAALIAAARPVPGEAGGTPALFASLQAASLASAISAELASGSLATAIEPFFKKPLLTAVFDSAACQLLVPTLLALIWMSVVHLQKQPGQLALAALLSVASSPMLLAMGWGKVAAALGVSSLIAAEKSLTQIVSVIYAVVGASLFFSSGTITLMSVAFVVQLLMRIHGVEPFARVIG